jgi:UDP-N-acetylglucosamine 2-epimerase (non-hydrolysing)
MVGTDSNKIIESTTLLLENKESYGEMIKTTSPFGDGKAAQRIVNILLEQI